MLKMFGQTTTIIDEPESSEIPQRIVEDSEPAAAADLASIPILFILMIIGTIVLVVVLSASIVLALRRRRLLEKNQK